MHEHELWDRNYCLAYSDGHNNRGLRDKRLDHYAHAYADISEDADKGSAMSWVGSLPLAAFFQRWDADAYEGGPTEHWHVAA